MRPVNAVSGVTRSMRNRARRGAVLPESLTIAEWWKDCRSARSNLKPWAEGAHPKGASDRPGGMGGWKQQGIGKGSDRRPMG